VLHVSFAIQCATWLCANCMHSFNLHIFVMLCLHHSLSLSFFLGGGVTEMVNVKEQHVCIKFCKSGKIVAKTHLVLKRALGDYALG